MGSFSSRIGSTRFAAVVFTSCFLDHPLAQAQSDEALKLIVETAKELCQQVPLEQARTGTTLNADLNAKIGGAVGKLVDMGFAGAANSSQESSKGILQKDLVAAIQDGNNCKLKVLEILKEKLLTEPPVTKTADVEKKLNITSYEVPNSEQFCARLKSVVISAKRKFNGDLIKSGIVIGNGFKHKISLPNSYYCAMNSLPFNGKLTSYYSCSLFHDEKSADAAYSKFSSYHSFIKNCLGSQWILSLQERSPDIKGAEASFSKDATDPTVDLRTREGKNGIDMSLYIQPPGTF